jgi:hypothetical protein
MRHLTYHVGMTAGGKPQVSVSSENPEEAEQAIPWVKATYARMTSEVIAPQPEQTTADALTEQAPTCRVHDVLMVGVTGRRGFFWSCHTKNPDGTWCTYRPIRP